jgi:uncharacterized oxidoreductase
MNIMNKTILITGGATGIGLELARLLVVQNNTVLVCGRRQSMLDAAAAAIPGLKTYVCDVGDSQQCRSLVDAIHADGLRLDILVNNAAVLTYDDFTSPDLDIGSIRNVFNGNVIGPIELVHLFLPDLLAQAGSMIVNVDSPAGRCPLTKLPIYAASKAALDFYTRSLRQQLQGKVKVVEVFPPTVATELTAEIKPALGAMMTPEKCAESLLRQLQQGKQDIWIGLDANIFRWVDMCLYPLTERIVNSPWGVKRK